MQRTDTDAQSAIKVQRQRESQEALNRLKACVAAVLAQHPVEAAYAFGSVARGTITPFSDIDVALLLTAPLPGYERLQLELTIQGEIEDAAELSPVDVRAINQAPLMVQGRIVQEGVLIYERDRGRRVAFEVATRKRYFDFAPTARRLRDAFLQRVRRNGLLNG